MNLYDFDTSNFKLLLLPARNDLSTPTSRARKARGQKSWKARQPGNFHHPRATSVTRRHPWNPAHWVWRVRAVSPDSAALHPSVWQSSQPPLNAAFQDSGGGCDRVQHSETSFHWNGIETHWYPVVCLIILLRTSGDSAFLWGSPQVLFPRLQQQVRDCENLYDSDSEGEITRSKSPLRLKSAKSAKSAFGSSISGISFLKWSASPKCLIASDRWDEQRRLQKLAARACEVR